MMGFFCFFTFWGLVGIADGEATASHIADGVIHFHHFAHHFASSLFSLCRQSDENG